MVWVSLFVLLCVVSFVFVFKFKKKRKVKTTMDNFTIQDFSEWFDYANCKSHFNFDNFQHCGCANPANASLSETLTTPTFLQDLDPKDLG